MTDKIITSVLIFNLITAVGCAKSRTDYINPFIGASTNVKAAGVSHGLGKTFPGAATPFGLVQVSPNTITGGDNGCGYSYEHTTIEGFAFTQMSGVGWYGDLGNFLVMPTTGPLKTSSGRRDNPDEGYRSRYAKDSEIAKAGYYAATLTDYQVRAEATAAPRSGMLRFTFSKNEQSRIQIDLARRVGGTSTEQYIKVLNDNTIQGWMKCTPEGGGWGNGGGNPNYTVYFYAQFSKPFEKYGVWSADIPDDWKRKRREIESEHYRNQVAQASVLPGCGEKQGKHLGFYAEYETEQDEQILLKAGISFVSMDGAKANLQAEIKDFDFDRVRTHADRLWDEAVSKIEVEGAGDDEKTSFYTALYHTMIDPRCFTDVDGRYPGGDGKIHQTDKFTKRTIFSGWDVFRSQFPLQNIINPEVVNDMINSLIELADESGKGYFERWEFLNAYSGCMLGNPAVSVMVDAYNKGIRDFDVEKGYQTAVKTCERFGNGGRGFSTHKYCAISSTLEYAYFEWCLSDLARSLGKTEDAEKYFQRSKSYKNIFDPSVQWFRPRKNDGTWKPWPEEGRLKQDYGSIESNPYQQGWFVPHDIDGLSELLGGRQAALADLTELFNNVPEDMKWNNYYNHANEPVHHIPFLFNRLGAPWLTQYWSRQICKRAYRNSVEGLVGNEDVGQMSAWYVLAASGLHPVCPGENRYEITSPVFERVEIKLDPKYATGKTFTIVAKNNSDENVYIQSARLNGKDWNHCWITHEQLIKGGTLELEMGSKPNKQWGLSAEDLTAQAASQKDIHAATDSIDTPQPSQPAKSAKTTPGKAVQPAENTESFGLTLGAPEYEKAYQLAISEIKQNIRDDFFIAGQGWAQLWTRDTAYSIELGCGLLHPKVSETSLRKCTEEIAGIGTCWYQDKCGHFGGWPNLSDAIVGAQGAWALYCVTGDKDFLAWAYELTQNSLIRAEKDVYDSTSRLFGGCSSFMESNSGYPPAYHKNGKLVAKTKALSTNILYYNGYQMGALMGQELNAPTEEIQSLTAKAERLKKAVRQRLWLPEKGHYAYFEDENQKPVHCMEALGQSLLLLAPGFESDPDRITRIFENTYRDEHGIPCLWPRWEGEKGGDIAFYYHNGRIWPFVQGYWAMAASRHKKTDILAEELKDLLWLSQRQNTFAEFYQLNGKFPRSRRRQLWSDAGYVSMVYHGLFGMIFEPDHLRFAPVKPQTPFAETITLENVAYRNMTLDIQVTGYGTHIRSFKLDSKQQSAPVIPADLTGKHKVIITLASSDAVGSD